MPRSNPTIGPTRSRRPKRTAREEPVRSLLVSGEHRVGKSTFLLLLAKRLQSDGWLVFEASGADLMAGRSGSENSKAASQRAISELAVSKKLIWYIPDLLQVALSGTHQGQSASILDQVMPAVTSGRLIIWTETSPAGMSRLLRLSPSLRSAFEVVRLERCTSRIRRHLPINWAPRSPAT